MKNTTILLAGVGTLTAAFPALAQQRAADAAAAATGMEAEEEAEIVVTGAKPRGSVIGDIPPEITLSPADVRSYGVSTLADLINELAPQTGSGQGRGGERPVILLNGARVSSFAEIRDVPTEAIQRVEILPEEVALKYGYRPDQKVINMVLRRRFRALTVDAEGALPTEGGQFSLKSDNSLLRINEAGRLNIALKYERSDPLYEADRDILPQIPRQPYDFTGNITSATNGAEIDPALSGLLGTAATVVGVPGSAASGRPALSAFVPGIRNVSDTGRYRTLLPATDALTLNGVLARTLFGNVAASFNGTFTYSESDSAQGPATAALTLPGGSPFSPFAGSTRLFRYLSEFDPLAQQSRDISGHAGATFNGALAGWQWSLTTNYDHTASRTLTDRGYDLSALQGRINALDPLANPFALLTEDQITAALVDRARSISDVADAELVVTGALFAVPAGMATTTVKIGGTMTDFKSRSIRSGIETEADLSRDTGNGQVNFDLPIASRRDNFLPFLGEQLTANFNAGYQRYSDFGGLNTIGGGVTWIPVKPLRIIASISKDEGAPTIQQLGGPLVTTTGVRVFDYVLGETVDVTRIGGGNPLLAADDRRVIKIGATLKPIANTDLTLIANYTDSKIKDPVASFPTATAAIEAAFPNRFTRDASGRLLQIDSRPINFAERDQRQLRWGFNFSKQIGRPTPPPGGFRGQGGPGRGGGRPGADGAASVPAVAQVPVGDAGMPAGAPGDGAPAGAPPPRDGERRSGGIGGGPGGGRGFGGPGGPGGFGGGGTRLQFAAFHTIHLKEQILFYEGAPVLDLLDGGAVGSSGGQSRHEVQVQGGIVRNGLGARLSGSWQSATRVDAGAGGMQSLRFSDLTTLNLRLFANLGQQPIAREVPFLRGARVTLSVTNLFNQRLDVRDATGATPISYQPGYLDALGRSVRISFRKLFF